MTDPAFALVPDPVDEIERLSKALTDELIAVRRDLHAHPELGGQELRTTALLRDRLTLAGLSPQVLPAGTGLLCDVGVGAPGIGQAGVGEHDIGERGIGEQGVGEQGVGEHGVGEHGVEPGVRRLVGLNPGGLVALRADIDALPVTDEKDVPYRSTVAGVCHACGHDVHTSTVLGAGLVLHELARMGRLPGPVRLVFQPAEEIMPGGAEQVIAAGGLVGVQRIFALHCDPREDIGHVGLKVGGITASADQLSVRLTGRGGHTARPHLTSDVVYALGDLVTRLPAVLSRRVDPRAGLSLVWGHVRAGTVSNVIPDRGQAAGTVRCLDVSTWAETKKLIPALIEQIVAPYGVGFEVEYFRGVPPVVNEEVSTGLLEAAAETVLGAEAVRSTEQSLGGEDFAWYLEQVPGALLRLGVHGPDAPQVDLHRGDFDVDERAIGIGVGVLVTAALLAWQDASLG